MYVLITLCHNEISLFVGYTMRSGIPGLRVCIFVILTNTNSKCLHREGCTNLYIYQQCAPVSRFLLLWPFQHQQLLKFANLIFKNDIIVLIYALPVRSSIFSRFFVCLCVSCLVISFTHLCIKLAFKKLQEFWDKNISALFDTNCNYFPSFIFVLTICVCILPLRFLKCS